MDEYAHHIMESILWPSDDARNASSDRHRNTTRHVAWLVAGLFAVASFTLSVLLIRKHKQYMRIPVLQVKVIGILWMAPIYALTSWLSLRFKHLAFHFDLVRDVYEGYVIHLFLSLMISYLSLKSSGLDERHVVELIAQKPKEYAQRLFPLNKLRVLLGKDPYVDLSDPQGFLTFCKRCTLQYTVLRPLLSLLIVVLDATDNYEVGSIDFSSGFVYVTVVQNVSVSLALFGLAYFYVVLGEDLKPYDVKLQFVCIKLVLFLSFWQGVVLALLSSFGALPSTSSYTVDDISTGVQNFLICFEMFLVSLLHLKAFAYEPFKLKPENGDARRNVDLERTERARGWAARNFATESTMRDLNQVLLGNERTGTRTAVPTDLPTDSAFARVADDLLASFPPPYDDDE